MEILPANHVFYSYAAKKARRCIAPEHDAATLLGQQLIMVSACIVTRQPEMRLPPLINRVTG